MSTTHFLDLILHSNKYKSFILEDITKEKYLITKYTHTSFLDIDEITHIERQMLLKFVVEDLKEQNAAIEKAKVTKR